MTQIESLVFAVFIGLVAGYILGHCAGIRAGIRRGYALAPIELRMTSLVTGKCQICSAGPAECKPEEDTGCAARAAGTVRQRSGRMGQVMEFVKMHGLGNDYVYVDLFRHDYNFEWPSVAEAVSDRHFGIGGDGLVLIMPSDHADVRMRMFNADGSEGEMCGNAIRCVAKYVHDEGIVRKPIITAETLAGDLELKVHLDDAGLVEVVTVDMGQPRLSRREIPMLGEPEDGQVVAEPIEVAGRKLAVTAVSMGNPHAVTFVDSVDDFPVHEVGPKMEHHRLFPRRVNAEFAVVHSDSEISMRVWERGSGETMACGTGACAAAVAAHLTGQTGRRVTVHLRGGDLLIEWSKDDNHVYMTGPANFVFSGQVDLEQLLKDIKSRPKA